MNVVSVTAETLEEALAQIQKQMGPDAVVVNVRKVPAQGVSRLWKQFQGIEVSAMPAPAGTLLDQRDEMEVSLEKAADIKPTPEVGVVRNPPQPTNLYAKTSGRKSYEEMRGGDGIHLDERTSNSQVSPLKGILSSMGIMPVYHAVIERKMDLLFSDRSDRLLGQEIQALRTTLFSFWRDYPTWQKGSQPHVFIGPPGTGKTTVLCKFLVQSALSRNEVSRVWRLDGTKANNADFLSIHAEILGLSIERSWSGDAESNADHLLIDMPGVNPSDACGIAYLQKRMRDFGQPQVHLVLNAAYEPQTLLRQIEAYGEFRPQDLILTHVDEEARLSKLWNLVLGTKVPISFLSSGQNIPGRFTEASPSSILPGENVRG